MNIKHYFVWFKSGFSVGFRVGYQPVGLGGIELNIELGIVAYILTIIWRKK